MRTTFVVAAARNGVIGRAGGLPWKISSDLKLFRRLTLGRPVIMGRRTWESLAIKPLPDRHNIVVTRKPEYQAKGALVVHSLAEALATARRLAVADGSEEVMPPKVEGKYERWNDFDFWRGLGIRLGQEEDWPWKTLEEAIDYRLTPMGLTFKQFMKEKGGFEIEPKVEKKYETIGWGTPSGKMELYSNILDQLGYDPLPQHYEPVESPVSNPELAEEYDAP